MDDESRRRFSEMKALHGKIFKARVSVLPWAFGALLFVLMVALGAGAILGLEKKQVALILALGWYIVLPVIVFIWAARTQIRKAASDQRKLGSQERPPDNSF